MKLRFLMLFACIALAVASAKSYTINFYQPVMLGQTELAPGQYKLDVNGNQATIRNGKIDAQAPVKVETADAKFARTTMRLAESGGKMRVAEIRLGGTTTRLVFSE